MRRLKKSHEDPLAARIREAIGASPDDEITLVTPQFERMENDARPSCPPNDFEALRSMSAVALAEMGCRRWNSTPDENGRVLMLFPGEWFASIPIGTQLESIMGRLVLFDPDDESDDIRFGCLAYGVRVPFDRSANGVG